MKKIFAVIKNIYFSGPAILLLLLIGGGFLANCFFSNTFLLDNRPLVQKPTKFSTKFTSEYEAYFNDTFAGRKNLVKKYAKLKTKLGFDNGYIINGLNGWAFYDSAKVPDGYTLVDYYGEVSFSPEDVQQMAEGMKAAKKFYAKRGIDYVAAVVPNKEGMYSEYMPERMQKARVSSESRTDRAISFIQENTDVALINWRTALNEAKNKIPYHLYFTKDSHWNNIGAYIAYEELARVLRPLGYPLDVPAFSSDFVAEAFNVGSDLEVSGSGDVNYTITYKPEQKAKNLIDEDHGFFQVWENPNAPIQKRILLIRDSMGIALMPYLQKDFAYGVYAHSKWNTREGLKKIISTYQPDLVIDETGERYFNRFMKYNNLYKEE